MPVEPSRRKMEVLRAVDGDVGTSKELASEVGIEKGNARERLSEYNSQGLLTHETRTGHDGTAPFREYIYSITSYGKNRLDWLEEVEDLMEEEGVSWKEAYERRRKGEKPEGEE